MQVHIVAMLTQERAGPCADVWPRPAAAARQQGSWKSASATHLAAKLRARSAGNQLQPTILHSTSDSLHRWS